MNKRITISLISLAIITLPFVAFAQVGIPCGGDVAPADHPCGFNDLIVLVNNIIHFLIYYIAVPLAALGFMWAGANLILNQNKEGAWSDAKERFWDIGMGFGIILGAYILIKMVLFAFLSTEQVTFMKFMLDITQ